MRCRPTWTAHVFEAVRILGLPVKLPAEQLTTSCSAALATRFRALAADHLEHADEAGKSCSLAIWNIERPAGLLYRIGSTPPHQRVWRRQ